MPAIAPQPDGTVPGTAPAKRNLRSSALIALSGFFFAVLQSVCSLLAAMSGLRLLLGVSSLAVSAGVSTFLGRLHVNWLRVPMIVFALMAAIINAAIVLQLRRLRARPSSQWRRQVFPARIVRAERLQLLLSGATLVLIAVEECFHFKVFRGL
jgi:hypothetical protein